MLNFGDVLQVGNVAMPLFHHIANDLYSGIDVISGSIGNTVLWRVTPTDIDKRIAFLQQIQYFLPIPMPQQNRAVGNLKLVDPVLVNVPSIVSITGSGHQKEVVTLRFGFFFDAHKERVEKVARLSRENRFKGENRDDA